MPGDAQLRGAVEFFKFEARSHHEQYDAAVRLGYVHIAELLKYSYETTLCYAGWWYYRNSDSHRAESFWDDAVANGTVVADRCELIARDIRWLRFIAGQARLAEHLVSHYSALDEQRIKSWPLILPADLECEWRFLDWAKDEFYEKAYIYIWPIHLGAKKMQRFRDLRTQLLTEKHRRCSTSRIRENAAGLT